MTPEETANLGILLADLGEPPSSITYAMVRRTDELRDLMASRSEPTLLETFDAMFRPTPLEKL